MAVGVVTTASWQHAFSFHGWHSVNVSPSGDGAAETPVAYSPALEPTDLSVPAEARNA
tara:strand:- start:481 stop:654 length:174 start_codon:yes stop_codon:yes gene_type:complete